ncbi:SlyX family protein [Aestuariibacter halophilus]|uniref:Protein SlyX homolog n=1 Tax=Fluctibacter halophilus TaxID=226011 RepID=A0ABS8GB38_9ALTE|nr:SlyX family protein [Aestuariibacter halophilus]MCC2617025.1 SlyX family protein [Aestuariibacter halophilus]
MSHSLEEEIHQLQMKVAFQEDTIEQLNEALSSQQKQLDALTFQMRHVVDKLKQVQPSNIARPDEETPPPHY